jgi:hypothetical protein
VNGKVDPTLPTDTTGLELAFGVADLTVTVTSMVEAVGLVTEFPCEASQVCWAVKGE